ncbi:hypothetical protein E2C01_074512 [Portunus trituberculatus]|uniref:Uncharacterized protein n=1 Tax=Portunus trituberculatus TaxID=210409 RepID=A0A5B7I872_PORTR|nr:hypothetical protein [Portunus trituberculatus]
MLHHSGPLTLPGSCLTLDTCRLPPHHRVPQRSGPEASEPVKWSPVGESAYRCRVFHHLFS